jgi:hypothetical protein
MRLTTADRLANCRALCRVVASRISWLANLQPRPPTAYAAVVFADTELRRPEHTLPSSQTSAPRDLKAFVTAVARPGDHVDKSQDAPPATTVIRRSLKRLKALAEGLGTIAFNGALPLFPVFASREFLDLFGDEFFPNLGKGYLTARSGYKRRLSGLALCRGVDASFQLGLGRSDLYTRCTGQNLWISPKAKFTLLPAPLDRAIG